MMHPRQEAKWWDIEAAYGMYFWDIVRLLAAKGLNRTQVADRLGYCRNSFRRLLRKPYAPAIQRSTLAVKQKTRGFL